MILKIKNLCGWCLAVNNPTYDVVEYLDHGNMCPSTRYSVNMVLKGGKDGWTADHADKLLDASRESNRGNVLEVKEIMVDNSLSTLQ